MPNQSKLAPKIVILISLIFLCAGCTEQSTLKIEPDIVGKTFYLSENVKYYLMNDGQQEDIHIKKGRQRFTPYIISTNSEGVTVLAVYTFVGETLAEAFIKGVRAELPDTKVEHYVIFVSPQNKLKIKQVQFFMEQVEWLTNQKLKVTLIDYQGKLHTEYMKNPF